MAIKLEGSVEVKRISEFLPKVIIEIDLENYSILIDNSDDDDSFRIDLQSLKTIFSVLPDNSVTNEKLVNVSENTIKGRITPGNGPVEDLSIEQVTSMLDQFTSLLQGLVPASGGGTDKFLRADGSWVEQPVGGNLLKNIEILLNGFSYAIKKDTPAGQGIYVMSNGNFQGYFGDDAELLTGQLDMSGGTFQWNGRDNTNGFKTKIYAAHTAAVSAVDIHIYNGSVQRKGINWASNSEGIIVTDQIDNKGLLYAADYSANYTDRSLIDKDFALSLIQITTYDFNLQNTTYTINNTSLYMKLYVRTGKVINKARIMTHSIPQVSDISVKLYDSTGAAITNGSGTLTPAVELNIKALNIILAGDVTLTSDSFIWVGIYQAPVASPASFVASSNARSNVDWNQIQPGTALGATVPTATATGNRICVELFK